MLYENGRKYTTEKHARDRSRGMMNTLLADHKYGKWRIRRRCLVRLDIPTMVSHGPRYIAQSERSIGSRSAVYHTTPR